MNSISMNPGPVPGWMDSSSVALEPGSSTSPQGHLAPEVVAKVVAEVAAHQQVRAATKIRPGFPQ